MQSQMESLRVQMEQEKKNLATTHKQQVEEFKAEAAAQQGKAAKMEEDLRRVLALKEAEAEDMQSQMESLRVEVEQEKKNVATTHKQEVEEVKAEAAAQQGKAGKMDEDLRRVLALKEAEAEDTDMQSQME